MSPFSMESDHLRVAGSAQGEEIIFGLKLLDIS